MTEPETRRKGARCALIHCLADFLGKRSPRHKSKQGKKPLALLRNAPCGKNRAPKKDCAARFFGKKEPQAPKQTGQETSCPVAKCALRKKQGSQKRLRSKIFWEKGAAGAKANRARNLLPCCEMRLAATWWSRRESNSRLTGLPKGFLHAYVAIILRTPPLRPKETNGRNLRSAVLPTSHQNGSTPPD